MFKPTAHLDNQLILPGDFFLPFGGKLDEENRWVQLARLVPWAEAEKKYGPFFKDTFRGQQTISLRMGLGALIIQERMQLTDRETLESINENPYMQYFIGLPGFVMKQPFHHSMMTHFRKRLTDVLAELNEVVATAGAKETKDHDDNNVSGGGGKVKRSKKRASVIEAEQQTLFAEPQVEPSAATSPVEQTAAVPEPLEATAPPSEGHPVSAMESEAPALPNQGTVLMDATCAPADVAYPTDLNLLNEAREKLESIIDTLHVPAVSKATKPRTYREKARKQFGGVQATQAGTQSDPQSNQAAARLRWTEPLHHRRASQGATAHAA
ncbi:Transposase domain (DUF772) [Chlamydia abortus]|uniref:Transposase InsH N-terminal domain-containing protein n=2 Tax=Paenibacillaceae TaxID=186822 RepID=A0A8J4M3T5_9BACL|nr:hypothetical protein J15TS10_51570 [Paenibacillus woosongensis]GIQ70430.1 hypothetical protein XYCOK13_32540 [Xylanibacillus composti]SHE14609.1 Transposase domain (DUF772) [Chlamydia abortus]